MRTPIRSALLVTILTPWSATARPTATGPVPQDAPPKSAKESLDPPPSPPLGPLMARTQSPNWSSIPSLGREAMAASETAPSRNPFLLKVEQDQDKTLRQINADAAREDRAADERARKAKLESQGRDESTDAEKQQAARSKELRELCSKMALSAVLLTNDGGSAVIDGRIYRVGMPIGRASLVLAEVKSAGVALEANGMRVALSFKEPPTILLSTEKPTSKANEDEKRDATDAPAKLPEAPGPKDPESGSEHATGGGAN